MIIKIRAIIYLLAAFLVLLPLGKAIDLPTNMDGVSYANLLGSNNIVTGIRGNSSTNTNLVVISGFQTSGGNSKEAFLYIGSLAGSTGSGSSVTLFSPPFSNTVSSVFYGPNTPTFNPSIGSNNIVAVGSYVTTDDNVRNRGMIYQGSTNGTGTWTSLEAPTTITPQGLPSYNTIAHSTMGNFVVGNYDIGNLTPGHAFIYNSASASWRELSVGSESTTAYGIWQQASSGSSSVKYILAGGYSDIASTSLTKGYLINYSAADGGISGKTTFNYNNQRDLVTHFEGITGVNGGVALAADYQDGQNSGAAYAFVPTNDMGNFGTASWFPIKVPNSEITSGNSVYLQSLIGLYVPGRSYLANLLVNDWTAGAGPWENGANWSEGVPSSNAIARIDSNAATVTLASNNGVCGLLFIGDTNSGNTLQLTGSSTFSNRGSTILGNTVSSSSNTLVLSDFSAMTNAGGLIVGSGGSVNNLTLTNHAHLVASDTHVGFGVGNSNKILISGIGTELETGVLVVGDLGINSSVLLDSGATLNIDGDFYAGSDFSATNINARGSLLMTGSSNTAQVLNQGQLACNVLDVGLLAGDSNNSLLVTGSNTTVAGNTVIIGDAGDNNSMVISNGGGVVSLNGFVGYTNAASDNNALVTGVGSIWSNSAVLTVGNAGTNNRLIIQDQGTVAASSVIVGGDTNTSGSILIGNGSAAGTLATTNVIFGSTTAALEFQETDDFYQFTPSLISSIAGAGVVVQGGTGTTMMSGSNSGFTGAVLITNGVLMPATTNSLGTGNVVLGGDALALARLSLGEVELTVGSLACGTNGVLSLTPGEGVLHVTGVMSNEGSGLFLESPNLSNDEKVIVTFGSQTNFTTSDFHEMGGSGQSFVLTSSNLAVYTATNANVTNVNNKTISNAITLHSLTVDSGTTTITSTGDVNATSFITINGGNMSNNGIVTTPLLTLNQQGNYSGTGTLNGNLVNSGIVMPGASGVPGTIVINGDLIQSNSGKIVIQVANTDSYSHLDVLGTAYLQGGIIQIMPLSANSLYYGQKISFLLAGEIEGTPSSIVVPNGYRGRFLAVGDPEGEIWLAPASYTQVAATPNQVAVASALDSFTQASSGDEAVVSTALDQLTVAQYPNAFNQISPALYTSLATLAFNAAVAQYNEMIQRLGNIRIAGVGFSSIGMNESPIQDDSKNVLSGGKDVLVPTLDNHWGFFVDGNGIFANVNIHNQLPGYSAQGGGVTLGSDYKWNEHFSTGVYAGYEGFESKQSGGSYISDNGSRFGLFGTYQEKGFFANTIVGGGSHSYQISRAIQFSTINRIASSAPTAGELDTILATGYDMKRGNFTFGPISSLQYTYFGLQPFTESGAQALDLSVQNANASSMVYSLGSHCFYTWKVNKNVLVIPQINIAWEHEFLQNPYALNSSFENGSAFAYMSTTPLRDSLYTGVGVTANFSEKYEASFFYNASAANPSMMSQNFFVSLGMKF